MRLRLSGSCGAEVSAAGLMRSQAETEQVYWGQTETLLESARTWGCRPAKAGSPWRFGSRGGSVSSRLQVTPLGTGLFSVSPAKFHSLGQGSAGGSPKLEVESPGSVRVFKRQGRREGLALPEGAGATLRETRGRSCVRSTGSDRQVPLRSLGSPPCAPPAAEKAKAARAPEWDEPLRAWRGGTAARGGTSARGARRVAPSAGLARWFAPPAQRLMVPRRAGRAVKPAPPAATLRAEPAPALTALPRPEPATAAATMLELLVALLALALAYFALLDGWYLVRVPCAVLRARLLQPRVRDLLAEQSYAGRVLPSDLDLLLHMNNARYLREADVARIAHLTRCGVLEALRALGARAVLAASCARYRRSLRLFEPFEVRTRLLGWDDRAFYVEARFISLRDGFVCALLRSRQHVLGTSPERVVQHLCKRRVSVPRPPHVSPGP